MSGTQVEVPPAMLRTHPNQAAGAATPVAVSALQTLQQRLVAPLMAAPPFPSSLEMIQSRAGSGTGPDTDVLAASQLYNLPPEKRLAVGKYVPDPTGAPVGKGVKKKAKHLPRPPETSSSLALAGSIYSGGPPRPPTASQGGPFSLSSSSSSPKRPQTSVRVLRPRGGAKPSIEGQDGGGSNSDEDVEPGSAKKPEIVLPLEPMVMLAEGPPVKITEKFEYAVVLPKYPYPASVSTLFFPVANPPTTAKDREDPRGVPSEINATMHQPFLPPLRFVQITALNTHKMCLFKIGPGAVAFKVVINALEASGMKYTPGCNWNIMWAKRADPCFIENLGPYQKLNHFPGAWGIGRKDSLHRSIAAMKKQFGESAFDIAPKTFLIPAERSQLEEDFALQFQQGNESPTYIVKPVASSCGKGIALHVGMPPMPAGNRNSIVQRYVGNPLLIEDRKFDLRMYCVVTSFDPLKIFLCDQGLVRFAAEKYPGANVEIDNIHKHLTNYSVNKTAALTRKYTVEEESDDPIDIKWALTEFRDWILKGNFSKSGTADGRKPTGVKKMTGEAQWSFIYSQIKDVVIKLFLSVSEEVRSKVRAQCKDPCGRGLFELYGLDLMLDDQLKVYIIEVNIMPSLATGASLDKAIKSRMLAHMLTLVGVVPHSRKREQELGESSKGTGPSNDRFYYSKKKAAAKKKTGGGAGPASSSDSCGTASAGDESDREDTRRKVWNCPLLTSLEGLTPAEHLMLLEADEECHRRGGFDRIFPTSISHELYFPLFPKGATRNDYLLASWEAMKAAASPPPAPSGSGGTSGMKLHLRNK